MVSKLDWRSSDANHGQRQEKEEEDAGDEGGQGADEGQRGGVAGCW